MGILDRLMSKAKSAKDAANRSELRRNPAEGDEEREAKEMLTGKITLDSINLGEIMPESSLKHIFMEESTMTKLGTGKHSGVQNIMERLVGGFVKISDMWFTWRDDDNFITYFVRMTLGLVLAVYVFYSLYSKHLNRYMNQVRHTLPYLLELD